MAGQSAYVDLWLAETQSSIAEATASAVAVAGDPRPLWISFTLDDDPDVAPRLRSGEPVADAAHAAARLGAAALLFNCSQPERMAAALDAAATAEPDLRRGAYANAFPAIGDDHEANDALFDIRTDLDPDGYCRFATTWAEHGATIIGGCCGVGPEQIAAVATHLG